MIDFLNKILTSTIDKSVEYLNQDIKISTEIGNEKLTLDTLKTIKHSSLISTLGSMEVDIAIGFDDLLFETLVKHFLNDEEVADDKIVELNKSISCEIINIIVGKATANYVDNTTLNITPSLFIGTMPAVFNDQDNNYETAIINTKFGKMAILVNHKKSQKASCDVKYERLKVLIVDDSLIVRKNMNKLLIMLNQEVIGEAKNGQEAVSMCRALTPDLITMDITMPDMDGITAVKKIREFDKNVKIIMSTSHGQEKMVLDSVKAGAKGYILKPLTKEKLMYSLKKIFPNFYFATNTNVECSNEDLENIPVILDDL